MLDGKTVVKTQENNETSKNGLGNHGSERHHPQPAHPAATIGSPNPNGEEQSENKNQTGNFAMAVFISNTANHGRQQRAVGKRPVGHRERGIIRSHQRTGDKQQERTASRERSEVMESAIVKLRHLGKVRDYHRGTV